MPSVYTSSLRLEEQGIGENNNTWGDRLNRTINSVDDAIAGTQSLAVSSGTTVLTTVNNDEDQARYRILKLTGTLSGNVIIEAPAVSKEYIVWDTTTRGGFTVTLRLGAAGNTLSIPNSGQAFQVVTDGTDWDLVSPAQASQTLAGVIEIATNAEAQTGTDATRALTPAGLQAVTATETRSGVIEIATTAEAQTGTDDARALTPSKLQDVTATEARKGVIEIATTAEAQAGSDDTRALTPNKLQAVTATETRKGVIEIATQSEVNTGTDSTRAVTPATLEGVIGSMAKRDVFISTGNPSGGSDGDIWLKY